MIDHISIPVRDLKASARFYETLLAPLGMTRVVERDDDHRLWQDLSGILA